MNSLKNQHMDLSPSAARSFMDKLFVGAFWTALLILTFLAGTIVAVSGIFPGPEIARAYQGGVAFYNKLTKYQDVYRGDLWYPERRPDKGVTVYIPGKAQGGLTLYTSGSAAAAYLIDMNGTVRHQWRRPFSTVWQPDAGWVANPQPDEFVHFRNAYAFPNGDLLALYEGNGDTPYGYGVVKLDRNSKVIWSYPGRAHHQLSVGPDGKIYVLIHGIFDDEVAGLGHLQRPRLEDSLVVLSPEGKELQRIRLLTAIAKSKYRHMLYTVSGFALADPLHANGVDYIDRRAATNFAFGREGQILLSFRELNAIAVLDLATQAIVWATRGPWIGQHDPDILPNGNILLFDNYGNYAGSNGISRLIEFNPRTMEILWEYIGSSESPLASQIRSDQQRLPNGNTLITESSGGRLVEVTREGEIVWEFINPVRGGPDGTMIPMIAWSQRLDPGSFDPSFLQPRQ